MTGVTQIISRIESGDRAASDQLLPLVYQELRKLAKAKLAHEKPGQTLQATVLVHEAYMRLPPGQQSVETDEDERLLAVFMEAIEQAQAMDRESVRSVAATEFNTERIVDTVIAAVNTVRLGGGIKTAASV